MITYRTNKTLHEEAILKLYSDAGWTSYVQNIEDLMKALKGSMMVVSAWSEDDLVGITRVIGDGVVIVYVQDILVLNDFKRKGIGRQMMKMVMDQYQHVRQMVLLTEDTTVTRGFYEALGFQSCDDGKTLAFAIQK